MRITAIEPARRRQTFEIHVDGEPACTVDAEVCLQFGLRAGDAITPAKLAAVRDAEDRRAAMAAALRLLSYRPRSERELRDRLAQKGFTPETRDATVARLRDNGLLDDRAFATHFTESRDRSSPRSARLIAAELLAKGVRQPVARETASRIDDDDAAYRAAARRARSLASLPFPDFRRRVGDFLLRRGFSYDIAAGAVSRLWAELNGATPQESESH